MIKKIYCCINFGESTHPENINPGDMIAYEHIDSPLQEICLLSGLDIPDLDPEILDISELAEKD